jgi:hypothetical protein
MRRETMTKAKVGSVTNAHYTTKQFEAMGDPFMWGAQGTATSLCSAALGASHAYDGPSAYRPHPGWTG